MKQYRKLSKLERLFQKFNNWTAEFADQKVMVAAFLFMVSCLIFWESMIR